MGKQQKLQVAGEGFVIDLGWSHCGSTSGKWLILTDDPFHCFSVEFKFIIIKSLDPLRAKKTFIRKKLGHTMVSAIKASSVTLYM